MRNKIFISHANPEDNDFAQWLYFKLTGLGYDTWCEIESLRKGEYFWDRIETLIRNHTAKFLFVASSASATKRNGVSDEFEFARTIANDNNIERFIYILKIDNTPSNARIGQHRINHIDFSKSWASGLKDLLKELTEEKIPCKDNGLITVNQQWQNLISEREMLREEDEIYTSNKFPISSLPTKLYAHAFKGILEGITVQPWEFGYPITYYGDYTITFAESSELEINIPKLIAYQTSDSIEIPVAEILDGTYDTKFISNKDAKNKLIYLLNLSINKHLSKAGLRKYPLANKKEAFWYAIDSLTKNKAGGVLMVGKQKEIMWHYAISCKANINPELSYTLVSHIIFTEDGKQLIQSQSRQHKARRKQGRQWWNNHWSEKMSNFFVPLLQEESTDIRIPVGNYKYIVVSNKSIEFISPVAYLDPDNDAEEFSNSIDDFTNLNDDDDE